MGKPMQEQAHACVGTALGMPIGHQRSMVFIAGWIASKF